MKEVDRLAQFVHQTRFEDIPAASLDALKRSLLDTIGCAIGGVNGKRVHTIKQFIEESPQRGNCPLIGGGPASPMHAALYNGACLRYLDFMDNYMAKRQSCHPSDSW